MINLINILKDIVLEYAPSDPANVDKAISDIRSLGYRNPLNPRETIIDDNVVIEVSNFDKRLWLNSIYSIEKGTGNATKVMTAICKIADKHSVTIALDPLPYGKDKNKLNYDQLVAFYKKFGFIFEDGEDEFGDMERIANQNN